MSKYDFGYVLEAGSTNTWAYNLVKENSTVLELGSSIGNLTYHLSDKKNCRVHIIEIDEEAGESAKRFAEDALIGTEEGDLNNTLWYEKLKEKKYDYIVILDVLEHLKNPEYTLQLVKTLLNENGKIILSIPNITHNAVILKMLDNKFEYTELGLLDKTHIHFFSYDTIIEMIEQVGLNIVMLDSIKKGVLDTEIDSNYNHVPVEVEYYMRTRRYGNVYQYLFILDKSKNKTNNKLKDGILEASLYETKILINGVIENLINIKGKLSPININLNLSGYSEVTSIRFIPVEQACLTVNLRAYEINELGKKQEIFMNWTTGVKVDEHTVILSKQEHEINYLVKNGTKRIQIKCDCKLLDEKINEIFVLQNKKQIEVIQSLNSEIESNYLLKNKIQEKEIANSELEENINNKNLEIKKLKEEVIITLEEKVKNKDDEIKRLREKVILELKENLNNQKLEIKKLEEINLKLQENIKNKDLKIKILKEEIVPELKENVSSKELEIEKLQIKIYDLDKELTLIKNTRLYKMIFKIYSKGKKVIKVLWKK